MKSPSHLSQGLADRELWRGLMAGTMRILGRITLMEIVVYIVLGASLRRQGDSGKEATRRRQRHPAESTRHIALSAAAPVPS